MAHKQLFLQERQILILTLKRFNNQFHKICTYVRNPIENLKMQNLVDEENKLCSNTRYNLFAVINHFGWSSTSGHYTLFMKVDKYGLNLMMKILFRLVKEMGCHQMHTHWYILVITILNNKVIKNYNQLHE